MPLRRVRYWALALPGVLLLGLPVRADLLYMKDGRVIEGEILEQGESIRIRMRSGVTASYPTHQIERIEQKKTATGQYDQRRQSLAPDDATGHLALGRWCVRQGMPVEAERAFRTVLTMASPAFVAAKFELGRLLEKRGRIKGAIAHYDELVRKVKHPDSLVRSRRLKRQLDAKRAGAFEDGVRALERRKPFAAVQKLEYAFHLTYPVRGVPPVGVVTEEAVLEKLARARALIDDENRSRATAAAVTPCKTCKGKGWTRCSLCGGKGKRTVVRQMFTLRGMRSVRRTIRCERCRGRRESVCDACQGRHVNVRGLESSLRADLLALAEEAYTRPSANLPRAVGAIHKRVIQSELEVRLPDKGAPYAMSGQIRKQVAEIPIPPKGLPKALTAVWRRAKPEQRANFLVDYGMELSVMLAPYYPLAGTRTRGGSIEPVRAAPALHELQERCEFVDAARASALPELYGGRWLAVNGIYRKTGQGAPSGLPGARFFSVETGSFHNLHPHTWAGGAAKGHAAVLRLLTIPSLKGVPEHYPYGPVSQALDKLADGERITLYGRLIYSRGVAPGSRLEVWAIEVRLDEQTERLLARVNMPITFNFQQTPLEEATSLISLLTGLDIDLDLPAGVEFHVQSRVHRRPLGMALGEMLKDTGLKWAFTADGVKIAEKTDKAEAETVQKVVGLLRTRKP